MDARNLRNKGIVDKSTLFMLCAIDPNSVLFYLPKELLRIIAMTHYAIAARDNYINQTISFYKCPTTTAGRMPGNDNDNDNKRSPRGQIRMINTNNTNNR